MDATNSTFTLRGGRRADRGFAVGDVFIAGGRIVPTAPRDAQEIDARGCLVLPGLVLGHTHLYSALSCGMPAPPERPQDFPDILRLVWWRLDRALDLELCETSAAVGAWLAVRCGVTTLVDHHASPAAIGGSLEAVTRGVERAGLRGVLCYELTDRNGPEGAAAGLAETDHFLTALRDGRHPLIRGLVGGHAPFTLGADTLRAAADLCDKHDVGFHVHVSEDTTDDRRARADLGRSPLTRLEEAGLMRRGTIIGHGVHLSAFERSVLAERGVFVAHNPRSNQNNHVGYARPLTQGPNVMLGTDGIGADLFAEGQAAFYAGRADDRNFDAAHVQTMLDTSRRYAAERFGEPLLGTLEPGAPADVVVLDDRSPTPVTAGNWPWQFIFTQSASAVRDVFVAGRPRLLHRVAAADVGESDLLAAARDAAPRLWARLAEIAPDPPTAPRRA
jgi:cytosine/adenosine deaminase-related metal-dependent hydrolase